MVSFSGVVCSVSRGVNGVGGEGWGRAWGSWECMISTVGALILLGNRDQDSALAGQRWGLGSVLEIRSFTDLGHLDP